MLPSSLNTPAGAALLSSETLNVLTLPAPSVTVAEVVLDNEGLRDGDEESGEGYPEEDDDDSDNNLEIVVQKSGTTDSTGVSSGGTEESAKKVKTILTQEEETFVKKFQDQCRKSKKHGK